MNLQKINMIIAIGIYKRDASQLPNFSHAARFLEKVNHLDKIPGNNQDMAMVLAQSLSLDIDSMINGLDEQHEPINVVEQKFLGILIAAQTHDMLLDGLKIKGNIASQMPKIQGK